MSLGDAEDSPVVMVSEIDIDPQLNQPRRVDITYPLTDGCNQNSSIGASILSKHENSRVDGNRGRQGRKGKAVISLSLPSPMMKQRFLGRLRALQKLFKGTATDEIMPLPNGETLNILTATWNVGDKGPPENLDDLEDWVPSGSHDIYAIGFQECALKKKWFKALRDHLCGESACAKLRSR